MVPAGRSPLETLVHSLRRRKSFISTLRSSCAARRPQRASPARSSPWATTKGAADDFELPGRRLAGGGIRTSSHSRQA